MFEEDDIGNLEPGLAPEALLEIYAGERIESDLEEAHIVRDLVDVLDAEVHAEAVAEDGQDSRETVGLQCFEHTRR